MGLFPTSPQIVSENPGHHLVAKLTSKKPVREIEKDARETAAERGIRNPSVHVIPLNYNLRDNLYLIVITSR